MNTRRVLLAGLLSSMVMGMIEMIYEAVAGTGFWSPVVFIAATILRDLQGVPSPVPFLPVPVVLGLMGHMMNSVILGIVFAAVVAPRLRGLGQAIVGGMIAGLVVFVVMWLVVVPLLDPVMLRLNGPVFAIAHLMWGGVVGVIVGLGETSPIVARQHAHL